MIICHLCGLSDKIDYPIRCFGVTRGLKDYVIVNFNMLKEFKSPLSGDLGGLTSARGGEKLFPKNKKHSYPKTY